MRVYPATALAHDFRLSQNDFRQPQRSADPPVRQSVKKINQFEPAMQALSDEQLRGKTDEFRQRIAAANRSTTCFPKLSPSSASQSARARHAHFDMQMIGGMVQHAGKFPKCVPAKARHWSPRWPLISTHCPARRSRDYVNDYLAKRDAEWMGRVYRFLGLSVGVNLSQMEEDAKHVAYASDITTAPTTNSASTICATT